MMVPDEDILRDVNYLLTNSDPGDELHHMFVTAAPRNAFGLPDLDNIHRSVYAISYDGSDPNLLTKVVVAAGIEQFKNKRTILYAAGALETVFVDRSEETDDGLAAKLSAEHRLSEHPKAQEITVVYAACSDGRRWTGRRYLTGPKAGQVDDAVMLVGAPNGDNENWTWPILLRRLVNPDPRPLLRLIEQMRT